MKRNDDFELYLNHMGFAEKINFPSTYEDYQKVVIHFMQLKGKYIFQSELMEERNVTNPEDLKCYGNYIEWGAKMRNDEWEPIYYCILADYHVQPGEEMYDLFFAYRLRQVDLIKLDEFLDYQLEWYYNANAKVFCRFLSLVLRKHKILLNDSINQTVQEWIEELKDKPEDNQQIAKSLHGDSEDKPMGIDEAATFLKLQKSTLYEKTSEHTIPYHKKGNKLYFYKSELEAWIKEGKVKTDKELESEAATYIQRKSGVKSFVKKVFKK